VKDLDTVYMADRSKGDTEGPRGYHPNGVYGAAPDPDGNRAERRAAAQLARRRARRQVQR